MSLANDLVGIGMVPEQALRLGFTPRTQAGVGTAQGGSPINKDTNMVTATTTAGQTAFTLPSNAELLVPYMLFNSTADAALVFPPTGGFINAAAVNVSVSVAQNITRMFMRLSTTRWASWLAA